jgi:1-acyl-sn-glycerol-3-phosphate acyltransferase
MSLSFMDDPAPAPDARALVDALIAERAPKLRARKAVWALLQYTAFPLLGYRKAITLVDAVKDLSGDDCFAWGDAYLKLSVKASGVEHVPRSGAVLIIANHPGGIADGNALWRALKDRRPDMTFFANRDALRICPGLAERIIPVEWRQHQLSRQRARETLKSAMAAFSQGRCVVIFPAGRMADWSWSTRGLVEPAWSATGVSIARRFNAPIVPMGVTQHMPLAYYALSHIHEELRDVTLFHGLLNQRGAHYRLSFGEPVLARDLPGGESEATAELKARCEALAWGPQAPSLPRTSPHSG